MWSDEPESMSQLWMSVLAMVSKRLAKMKFEFVTFGWARSWVCCAVGVVGAVGVGVDCWVGWILRFEA